jgi:hypothetical protein
MERCAEGSLCLRTASLKERPLPHNGGLEGRDLRQLLYASSETILKSATTDDPRAKRSCNPHQKEI